VESNKAVKTAAKSNHHICSGLGQSTLPRKSHKIDGSSTVTKREWRNEKAQQQTPHWE
jgi:hypothetical protein